MQLPPVALSVHHVARSGRVLILAGSDSGGGAGVQADIKTVTALGGYAATAITAHHGAEHPGRHGVHPVAAGCRRGPAAAVLDDIGADAIKTGMLGDAAMVETVGRVLDRAAGVPAVIDPVMVAKGGAALLASEAVAALRRYWSRARPCSRPTRRRPRR